KEDCGRLRKIVYVRSKTRDRVTMIIADVDVVVDLLFFSLSYSSSFNVIESFHPLFDSLCVKNPSIHPVFMI
ncbi:MAG TPA: hypothetical protein VE622_01020, partial [Nitrososphaeraceae archaeon]|nr:hypothetical protein [Nitrososphaeraceae archaeon]